jgi:hypothetical protein
MAQLTITESYWTVIYRNEQTSAIYKEEYFKGTTTTDEEGNVVGQSIELVDVKLYPENDPPVAAPKAKPKKGK